MLTVDLEPLGELQLCPGDSDIAFVCTVGEESTVLSWRVTDSNHPKGVTRFFTSSSGIGTTYAVPNFMVTLLHVTSTPPAIVSTAFLIGSFDDEQNGTVLTCSNTLSFGSSEAEMASAILTRKGK